MIEIKNGRFIAKGITIEVLTEYAFITGALAAQLKNQGVKDAEKRLRRAAEHGMSNFERMVKSTDGKQDKD